MSEWSELKDRNLVKNLDIPIIGGHLKTFFQIHWENTKIAFREAFPDLATKNWAFMHTKEFRDFALTRQSLHRTYWLISFESNGPDRRYNRGYITIHARQFPKFYDAVLMAIKRLEKLRGASTIGTYHEKVGTPDFQSLEVVSDDLFHGLRLYYSNGRSTFYLPISSRDLEPILEGLSKIPSQAIELMAQLEQLK